MNPWFRAEGPLSRISQDLLLKFPLHPSQFSVFLPPGIVCFLHLFWRFLSCHLPGYAGADFFLGVGKGPRVTLKRGSPVAGRLVLVTAAGDRAELHFLSLPSGS